MHNSHDFVAASAARATGAGPGQAITALWRRCSVALKQRAQHRLQPKSTRAGNRAAAPSEPRTGAPSGSHPLFSFARNQQTGQSAGPRPLRERGEGRQVARNTRGCGSLIASPPAAPISPNPVVWTASRRDLKSSHPRRRVTVEDQATTSRARGVCATTSVPAPLTDGLSPAAKSFPIATAGGR